MAKATTNNLGEVMTNNLDKSMNNSKSRKILRYGAHQRVDSSVDVFSAANVEQAMRLRADWSGDSGSLGTFAIWTVEETWALCGNLSPESSANDLILGSPEDGSSSFAVQIERGPDHPDCPFQVWAYPVLWQVPLPPRDSLPASTSVYRDTDYIYQPNTAAVHQQSASKGGVEQVALILDASCDYELWIKLRHPEQPGVYCIQDPIVNTGDRGNSPTVNASQPSGAAINA